MRPYLTLGAFLWCASSASAFAAHGAPEVGSVPPDFTTRNAVTGQKIQLSTQHGKVVVLTFWATWCAPCRREIPILETVQRKLGDRGLVVYAVSYHQPHEDFRELRKSARDWQITLIEDWNGYIAGRYVVTGIPRLFVIGRDGKVIAAHTGYGDRTVDDLVADLNLALKPPAAPADDGTPVAPPAQ